MIRMNGLKRMYGEFRVYMVQVVGEDFCGGLTWRAGNFG